MKTYPIIPFHKHDYFSNLKDFEESIHNSKLNFSLLQLAFTENISNENIVEALQKSLQICALAGIESKRHFKKVYIYDATIKTMHLDWRMSKKGFNLMVMQFPSLNENKARWLWELANI
ncbi:hypothetical protein [Flavobacterium sp.]|uniref:hypothetical protein n=1 Tax=Flavobacterium sp. TaxID=239 RepID=UPI003751FCF7